MKKLDKRHYKELVPALKGVSINHLFAQAVLEKVVDGLVYVDEVDKPGACYIKHPYGMSLLFGETTVAAFKNELWSYMSERTQERGTDEWLQVFPDSWAEEIIRNCTTMEKHTRVNFKFNESRYLSERKMVKDHPQNCRVVPTKSIGSGQIKGSVCPRYFWRNEEHFANSGAGYSLLVDDEIAATAFSAFIHGNQLELGIETMKEHQGKGFARMACAALIDYCLENGYEPVWACRLENTASFHLAQKLGFEPMAYLPYFRIKAGSI